MVVQVYVLKTATFVASFNDYCRLGLVVDADMFNCAADPVRCALLIPDLSNSDPFHGIIAVHSGRRGAQRDAVHRASNATHPMGRNDPPGGPGAFSRQLRCAPLVVHVPLRGTRLAGGKNRSGEMGRCY